MSISFGSAASLGVQSNLDRVHSELATRMQRLSSGFRINTAADDASGIAIGESMRSNVRGYLIAQRNANSALSSAQVAEGAIGSMISLLGRMRDLAVQASNGDLTSTDRSYLNTEYSSLTSELDRIRDATKYNGQSLLSSTTKTTYQVGIGTSSENQISLGGVSYQTTSTATAAVVTGTPFATVDTSWGNVVITSIDGVDNGGFAIQIDALAYGIAQGWNPTIMTPAQVVAAMNADGLFSSLATASVSGGAIAITSKSTGLASNVTVANDAWTTNGYCLTGQSVSGTAGSSSGFSMGNLAGATSANAVSALATIDSQLKTFNQDRASYGASISQLRNAIQGLSTQHVNESAALSRLIDADVAEEAAGLARNQVLQQAGMGVLQQTQSMSQLALSLLRG